MASGPKFPARRSDGTGQIGAVFSFVEQHPPGIFVQQIQQWDDKVRMRGDDIYSDLAELPVVVVLDEHKVMVIFNIRAGSKLWKDRFVELTRLIQEAQVGIRLAEIADLVAGGPPRRIDPAFG